MKAGNQAELARRRAQADAARGRGWKLTEVNANLIAVLCRAERVHPNEVLNDIVSAALMAGEGLSNLSRIHQAMARAVRAQGERAADAAAHDQAAAQEEAVEGTAEERLEALRRAAALPAEEGPALDVE